MGFFTTLELEVVEMYFVSGMKESEIAESVGITELKVHEILVEYQNSTIERV